MNEIIICNRKIGINHPPLVIAEIGINHEGDINKAIRMVHDAHKAGAECVKFQCHVVEDEMSHRAKETIPANSDESIYDIMSRNALTKEQSIQLKKLVESLGMIYLSTPFSRAAADRLESMGVPAYKIGSGECNNYPLVEHIAKFGKPVILSTGMNNIDTIRPAVNIFKKYNTPFGLLHCTSMYPTPYDKVHLGAIKQIREEFPDAVVGLSDHSLGNYTSYAAIPLGASIIEKHFTSDKSWFGSDIPISINPEELYDLIHGTRAIYTALGGKKEILKEEQPTIDFAYASVTTIKEVQPGELFTENNIWVKRPGTGEIPAAKYKDILGKASLATIKTDTQVKWSDIEDEQS